jgi:cell shape-determining protein MreC
LQAKNQELELTLDDVQRAQSQIIQLESENQKLQAELHAHDSEQRTNNEQTYVIVTCVRACVRAKVL